MCYRKGETHDHLFLHYEVAQNMWTMLFDTFVLVWIALLFLTCFVSLSLNMEGLRKDAGVGALLEA